MHCNSIRAIIGQQIAKFTNFTKLNHANLSSTEFIYRSSRIEMSARRANVMSNNLL